MLKEFIESKKINKIDIKNMVSQTYSSGEGLTYQEYKCLFDEWGRDKRRFEFLWLEEISPKYHHLDIYLYQLDKVANAILCAVDEILTNKTEMAAAKVSGDTQIQIDTYTDFGKKYWRITFGVINNWKFTQRIKGIRTITEIVVIGLMMSTGYLNLQDNGMLGNSELFS